MQNYSLVLENEPLQMKYYANRPVLGAKKIFRKLARDLKTDEIEFEIMNNKSKKIYKYYGIRRKLEKSIDNIKEFKFKGEDRVFLKMYKYEIRKAY